MKTIKFNNGQISIDLDCQVQYSVDLEKEQTILVIPGMPTGVSKTGKINKPILKDTKHYFIYSNDDDNNFSLTMVQGDLDKATKEVKKAKTITNDQFIEIAQQLLNDMKKEQ